MFGSPQKFVHVVAWLCAAVLPEPIANRRIMALISFARRSHIVTELLDIRIAVAYTHSLSQTPVFIVTQFNIIMFPVFFCARERFADRLKLTLRLILNFRLRISLRLSIGFVGFFRKPLGFQRLPFSACRPLHRLSCSPALFYHSFRLRCLCIF